MATADSAIGSLPQVTSLDDDSMLVAEQQGVAMKVSGAQFKEFGRQAVIGQVQGYVDQANAAADRAVDAVSSVTDMTVEAHANDTPTVTKSMKDGKVNLNFGFPRGEQGVKGETGPEGPRGPQGPTGKTFTILGTYSTENDLRASVVSPNVGDAYGVGSDYPDPGFHVDVDTGELVAHIPYDVYIYQLVNGTSFDWVNYGPLLGGGTGGGGGGEPLPENVVISDGGATLTYGDGAGNPPHTIKFTFEEDAPLKADDIVYDNDENVSVKDEIESLKSSVSDGKALVASAITDKGVPTAQDATFQQMADNIGQIEGGGGGPDTSDATATSFDILAPKTAYTAAGKVTGTIPTLLGQTIMPGTEDKTIDPDQYLGGTQVIKGDANLTSDNIRKGVTLFGVEGQFENILLPTLTVKADIGAVVTARCDDVELEELSTTGAVTFELPIEGTWKVTAVRGIAQYNTAVLQVSTKYYAELTAEVFVEYYKLGTPLSIARYNMAIATV